MIEKWNLWIRVISVVLDMVFPPNLAMLWCLCRDWSKHVESFGPLWPGPRQHGGRAWGKAFKGRRPCCPEGEISPSQDYFYICGLPRATVTAYLIRHMKASECWMVLVFFFEVVAWWIGNREACGDTVHAAACRPCLQECLNFSTLLLNNAYSLWLCSGLIVTAVGWQRLKTVLAYENISEKMHLVWSLQRLIGLYVNSKYVSMVLIFHSACDCWAVCRIFVPGCHEVNDILREAVMRRSCAGSTQTWDICTACFAGQVSDGGEFRALQSKKKESGYALL